MGQRPEEGWSLLKKTYIVCLNRTEFVTFLYRIPEINDEINNLMDQPYVYCWDYHTVTQLEDFDVILWGRYWKGKMYGTKFYDKHLKNKARFVADPGPEIGRGWRIRAKAEEFRARRFDK